MLKNKIKNSPIRFSKEKTNDIISRFLNNRIVVNGIIIQVRECISVKERYEVYISKEETPYNYCYSCGKATPSKVVEILFKYEIIENK